jgi:hypothetical protein
MTSIVPRGILANQFWIDAKAYVQAAEVLISSSTPNINQPLYFLLSHALELTLKAYLLARGADEADLIKIGHNLKRCSRGGSEARAQGQGRKRRCID